ncbi:MAG: HD domain-containing protein [Desulfobacula sp.]|nr:HD domain-containing protein [Desulfobacula sp.]
MTDDDYRIVKNFFDGYTRDFIARAEDSHPYVLKREHTLRVVENIVFLGKSLGLSSLEMGIAKTAALLHDIGRFIQYERYSTFSDPSSEDHAALGVQVIQEQDLMASCPPVEKARIIKAIALHNARNLPQGMDEDTLMLARLLRDADKLDIFGVMTQKYLGTDPEENGYITLNLKDDGLISEDLMTDILKKESIDNRKVSSLNDLKLLHISWVFDLNLREAVKRVDELEFIPLIISTMPDSQPLVSLLDFVKTYMKNNSGKKK